VFSLYIKGNSCGGGVEYVHHDPASRKRRWNGTKKGRTIAQAVSRWLPTAAVWGSRPGVSCGILWWTKWRWGRFSLCTSVSPANFHSTNNCSKNHPHLSSGLSTIDHCGSRCKGCKCPPLIHTYIHTFWVRNVAQVWSWTCSFLLCPFPPPGRCGKKTEDLHGAPSFLGSFLCSGACHWPNFYTHSVFHINGNWEVISLCTLPAGKMYVVGLIHSLGEQFSVELQAYCN
jgi:hypothetical protein